ncbi:MAG: MFS transporter [Alphaproteobacteria bacterium]|nr:MFS transporter [Alphaproteobacteria bacterium]
MSTLLFIRQNLRFLAFGFTLTFVCNFGQTFFIGFYNQPIRDAYGLTGGDFGALYGLATLCGAGVLVWVGRLIDHIDLRYYTVAVILFMALACALMSLDAGIGAVAAALFLLRLTGQGLMPHISSTSMGRYFEAGRGRALSISALGVNLGLVVLPAVCVFLIAKAGWRESWGLYALFLICIVLPAVLMMLKGHKARHSKWQAEMTVADSQTGAHSRMKPAEKGFILGDPRFYLIMSGFLAIPLFATAVFFFQSNLLQAKGWDAGLFAFSMPFFALSTTICGLFGGWLVDKIGGSLKLLPFVNLPFGMALVVLAFADHAAALPAMLALMGVSNGIISIVGGALWPELYGTRRLGAVRSVTTSIMIFGTAGIPAALGYLYDGGLRIETSYLWFAGYILLCCLIQLPLAFRGAKSGAGYPV